MKLNECKRKKEEFKKSCFILIFTGNYYIFTKSKYVEKKKNNNKKGNKIKMKKNLQNNNNKNINYSNYKPT